MSSRIERLRNLFLLAFLLLIFSIIFTPLLIKRGISIFPEEILESFILLVQVSVAWQIFRLYEGSVRSREREIEKLESEYQKREKELLEAFAYLGKVNVQVSLIKSFLGKLKAPSSRKEAENYINEILKIVLSLSGKKWVTLRVIDMKTLQTIKEYWAFSSGSNPETDRSQIKIGNKDIARWEKKRSRDGVDDFYVFSSSGRGVSASRVFLVFQNGEILEPDIEDFLRAAANQCEVLLAFFENKEKDKG